MEKVDFYKLEPFAIRRKDDGVSVVLVNRSREGLRAEVAWPEGMKNAKVYQFEEADANGSS